MTAPDAHAIRAYHAALNRHRAAALRQATYVKQLTDSILDDLYRGRDASSREARDALHQAVFLLEALTAIETLTQDAEHLLP
ncbi:MAG: hypothetical protein IRZ07_28470 [Microbispora sp.]|nr:hypothetical protein [Microbispora sp.]